MKILNRISLVAVLLSVGTATPLLADSIAPGGSVTPVTTTAGTFTVLASTGVQSFAFAGTTTGKHPTFPQDTGTVEEQVGTSSSNPFGAGALTFEYQFSVTKGDIAILSGSDFTGYLTDVADAAGYLTGFSGTELAPIKVTRSDGSGSDEGANVDFHFTPNAVDGQTSYILIVNTNATQWDASTIGLIDSGADTFAGFQPDGTPIVTRTSPSPEPSSLLLLGTGVLGVGAAVRRRFSI